MTPLLFLTTCKFSPHLCADANRPINWLRIYARSIFSRLMFPAYMRGRFSVKSMPPHLCAVDFRPNQCLRINARSFFSRVRGSASVLKYETDLRGGFAVVQSRPAVLQCLSHRCKVLSQRCEAILQWCWAVLQFCNAAQHFELLQLPRYGGATR